MFGPFGSTKDSKGAIESVEYRPLDGSAPNPMLRSRIDRNVETGVRVIDGLLSLGKGQKYRCYGRVGCRKVDLNGNVIVNADVNVIALVGERGREVRDLLKMTYRKRG